MAYALAGCVSSLQSSTTLLASSISTLEAGVNDFPRLIKVLQTTRHFELLPESTLREAQSSLLSSLIPEVDSLLSRVETHLDKMARREQQLQARYELQQGRMPEPPVDDAGPTKLEDDEDGMVDVQQGIEQLRIKQQRAKKERLSYAVERLTLQAAQRERQLRQSSTEEPTGSDMDVD